MKISETQFNHLNETIQGNVLLPDNIQFEESRKLWNGMFDKHPAVIIQPINPGDIQKAVRFGVENQLEIAIKGGGHNSAGTGMSDGGLTIDLCNMTSVEVNAGNKTVKVQGGALLSQVDEETQKHGLAVSAGIVSHTGVGGLTLGGGFGWISRKYGLSVDNLISVELVTAAGEIVVANETENPDLFWAVRGGGGNFGVVTTFEFQAASIGTEILSGPIVKRFEDMEEYIKFHREYVRSLPDEMTVWMVIRHAPPLPFIPENYHGKLVVLIPFAWLGEENEGQKLIQPIRDFGETIGDGSGIHPWCGWQSAFDGLVEHGARNYWKSHHLTGLSDDCIIQLKKYAVTMPSQECEIFIPHMEGAPSRIPENQTAFPHRYTPFLLNIHCRWQNAQDDNRCIKWAKDLHKDTEPFSQGVYVNFISDEGAKRVKDAYTPQTWERLVQVKSSWDKNNAFRMNQNIQPEIA